MEQNPLYQFTSLSRAINPLVYVTHRILVVLVPLAGVILGVYTLLTGGDFGMAVVAGFYAGASAMLAWVLAREIDPDYPYSAFVALGLATIGAFFAVPNILALAGAVVLIRIVNRIVGFPAKITDYILAVALGVITMLITGVWIFGAVVALALLLDAQLPEPAPLGYTFAFVMLLIMLPTWGYLNVALVAVSRDWLPLILGIGAVFIGHILTSKPVTCRCDATDAPPHPVRVRAGMGLMLVMAVSIGLIHGDAGTQGMMPLWATFIGVMVYRGMMLISKRG
jgi:hypothetical protein